MLKPPCNNVKKLFCKVFSLIMSTDDRYEENQHRGIRRHTSMFSICILTPGRSTDSSNNFNLIPSKYLLNLTEFLFVEKKEFKSWDKPYCRHNLKLNLKSNIHLSLLYK